MGEDDSPNIAGMGRQPAAGAHIAHKVQVRHPPHHVDHVVALENPEVRSKLEADGGTPMVMGSEQFTQLVKSDTERWGQLTRSINLKAN